jgi:hypothetical protein
MNFIGDEITEQRRIPLRERLDRRCYFWGTIATAGGAIVGAGVSLYGANKQAQNQKDANAANTANIDKSNNLQWNEYLMQRGIQPTGQTTTGQVPTSFTPVNSRLPLWANVNPAPTMAQAPGAASPPLVVRRRS